MAQGMSIHSFTGCLNNHHNMGKECNSQRENNHFESLPDELVIFIFTKLSSSSNKKNFLDDIKLLGRCSSVSKRFNALTCLVPTLSIRHPNINTIYLLCPKILKKFRHIHSLQITHLSSTEIKMIRQDKKPLPFIFWEAAYRPHSYRLAVVSYKKKSHYSDDLQKQQSLMLSDIAAEDNDFSELIRHHILDMIYLHHMLVSSIKEHKYLQRVVVTDFRNRGTLTLEEDMLVELRNCTSTNLEQVVARDRSGSVITLDVPSVKPPRSGEVMNNFYFTIIEWLEKDMEKDTDDHIYKDDERGLPRGMHLKCHQGENLTKVLASVMENPDDVMVNDAKVILETLTHIKSVGYLL